MGKRKYKVGDRIFYSYFLGEDKIATAIVLDVEDDFYVLDDGKKRPYKWLVTWRDGNCSGGIEDYNCISPNDPRCKELADSYAKFDKQKDKVMDSITKILEPWDPIVQKEILSLMQIKIDKND